MCRIYFITMRTKWNAFSYRNIFIKENFPFALSCHFYLSLSLIRSYVHIEATEAKLQQLLIEIYRDCRWWFQRKLKPQKSYIFENEIHTREIFLENFSSQWSTYSIHLRGLVFSVDDMTWILLKKIFGICFKHLTQKWTGRWWMECEFSNEKL